MLFVHTFEIVRNVSTNDAHEESQIKYHHWILWENNSHTQLWWHHSQGILIQNKHAKSKTLVKGITCAICLSAKTTIQWARNSCKGDNQIRKGWDVFVRKIITVDKWKLRHWDRKLQVVGNWIGLFLHHDAFSTMFAIDAIVLDVRTISWKLLSACSSTIWYLPLVTIQNIPSKLTSRTW